MSVFDDQTPASDGRPAPAGPGDSALYASGTTATFDSWSGAGPDADRVRHSEQVVVRSTASCAALMGAALPSGTFCTVPAPGAPAVDPAGGQCWGDAGGALLASGKLIGISATESTGCVPDGVRLYTRISSYAPLILDWSRDVDADFTEDGSVIGTEPPVGSALTLADICTTDLTGSSLTGCAVDNRGEVVVTGYNLTLEEGDADIVARDTSGVLWLYRGDGKGGFAARQRIGGGWNQYKFLVAGGDIDHDGRQGFLGVTTSGAVCLYNADAGGGFAAKKLLRSANWSRYTSLT